MKPIDRLLEAGVHSAQAEAMCAVFAAMSDEQDEIELKSLAEIGELRALLAAKEQEFADQRKVSSGLSADLVELQIDVERMCSPDRTVLLKELTRVRQELADTVAAVNEFGGNIDYSKFGKPRFWHGNSSVDYPTYTAACLAAYHAENAEVKHG